MEKYIDGFVFPISRDHVDTYQRVAQSVAAIYKEHGALDYVEFIGDDMSREGTRTFPNMSGAAEGETVVFGWVVFESREARDIVNARVEADARMGDLVAPLVDPAKPIFDAARMAYGGFRPFIRLNEEHTS